MIKKYFLLLTRKRFTGEYIQVNEYFLHWVYVGFGLWIAGSYLHLHLKVYVLISHKADIALIGYIVFK